MARDISGAVLLGEEFVRFFDWVTSDEPPPPPPPTGGGGPMIHAEAGSTYGAGFQNALCILDPAQGHTPGIALIGGDTAGTSVTFNLETWRAANEGRDNLWQFKISGLEGDPHVPNQVWCYSTNDVNAGIFWGKVDPATETVTWTLKYTDNTQPDLGAARTGGDNHPRQTGRMIACDPYTAGRAYVATKKGVVLCTGTSATSKFRATDWYTSVCIGPESTASNTVVYATCKDDVNANGTINQNSPNAGVTRATFQGAGQTGGTVTTMTGANAPTTPWEVVAVNEGGTTVLYVADGTNGIKRYNGTSWSVIQAAPAGVTYKSIDARRVGSITKVIAGHSGGDTTSSAKMIISDDEGATWTALSNAQTTDVVTALGIRLWLYIFKPYFKLSQSSGGYDAARVLIQPNDTNTFVSCGRSGVWKRKTDAGTRLWNPIVKGFGASVALDIKVHPTDESRLLMGDVDWSVPTAGDYLLGPPHLNEPSNHNGHSVAWDRLGGAYVGMGARDSATGGEVFYNPDVPPWGTETWRNLGLQARIGANDFRVLSVLAFDDENDDPVVLAITQSTVAGHGGIWRRQGTRSASGVITWGAAFARVGDAGQGVGHGTAIRFRLRTDGQGRVYAYVANSGLWRSLDYGRTWTNMFPITSTLGNRWANDIAVSSTGSLYLATASDLWRIRNPASGTLSAAGATQGGTVAAAKVGLSIPNQGPIDADEEGRVYMSTTASSTGSCGLYVSSDDGVTWPERSNKAWKALAAYPISLAVSKNGSKVYAALDGLGYAVGTMSAA